MTWPRDDAKLDRVRALMADHDLDALVVRAPDNVLYLTNFWGMKGYDACVFPREGEPVLIALEASEARFRVLTESSIDLISVTEENGVLRYQSAALRHLLGFDPASTGRTAERMGIGHLDRDGLLRLIGAQDDGG